MYLKRMDLFGFKSFAEKTELALNPGIAAIIGPNGCGKSNLVDAVRWALGEQSVKSLRGTRMEEIIFSGSEKRKPLNFAEVALTFEGSAAYLNVEYDEITITRRLFRNGDSEYYINKSPCRLKDITELFLDTGLGKEVYSIIGQGRVDEIINSRPEERRELFEEAAGIFKYKLRKREAGRRLEETRDNLIRVQDLIFELETQVLPLEEQAAVTRKYRDLQGQVQRQEQRLLSFQVCLARSNLQRVDRQLNTLADNLATGAAQMAENQQGMETLRLKFEEKRRRSGEREEEARRLEAERERQESEVRLLREREKNLTAQLEQNRLRTIRIDESIKAMAEQKTGLEQDLRERESLLAHLEGQLTALRDEEITLARSRCAQEVEKGREELYEVGVRREAALSTRLELHRHLEKLTGQRDTYTAEQAANRAKRENLDTKIKALQAGVGTSEESLTLARREEETARQAMKESGLHLEKLREKEQEQREKGQGVRSRLELLKEQDAAFSGYYRGVKEVLRARQELPGLVGAVADLIVVDKEYDGAIEAALGAGLQYLVVESEKAAHGAINYLKKEKRGWATFLPLDILRRGTDPLKRYPGWRDCEGVIGLASELVAIDERFRRALDYLAGSTVVCRDLIAASGVARYIQYGSRVVTLDGEVINPGGVMRGGSVSGRNPGMPLGRRREIETLEQNCADLAKELVEAGAAVQAAAVALEEKSTLLEQAVAKREALALGLRAEERKLEESLRERSGIGEREKETARNMVALDTEHEDTERRIAVLDERVIQCDSEREILERDLAGKKEAYNLYQAEKRALEEKITDLLVRISSCREQGDALRSRLEELSGGESIPLEEKAEKEAENRKLKEELTENRAGQEAAAQNQAQIAEKQGAALAEHEKIRRELSLDEAALMDLEEEERRLQAQTARRQKRERQLSLEQVRLETEVGHLEQKYSELYQSHEPLDLEDGFDPEDCTARIKLFREELEALGEVNLGAIEELQRLEKRIGFLNEQKEDLEKGEASLHKVLLEIDQRMEYYFNQAFAKINENFQQTFYELFEGGQVLLKLTDPARILDSGIDIIAQPPGKKLQNISLLSAGEKVLTAIALVFAILRYKPAPFYLLDEVESALDDANLSRFMRFLKLNEEHAQFVLITHRKRTMEEAAVLYGVTMPEPGVSRLMSLRLEQSLASRGGEH